MRSRRCEAEAVSFAITCRDQAEVDYYWKRLLTGDPDPAPATAATKAMLGMRKIVIAELEDAVAGLSEKASEPGVLG